MNPRIQFARTAADLVDTDLSVALVYAEISGQFFGEVEARHPDRVINVGIREQLLVNVGAGLALTGLRPIVHTFGSFLVERAFEQVKLGFGHQDVGGVLVGSAARSTSPSGGRTHQTPGDVALVDTLPGISDPRARRRPREVDAVLRRAVAGDGLHYVRVVGQTNAIVPCTAEPASTSYGAASGATVIALGPVLDEVLAGHRGAGRDRALRAHGPAVRRRAACARCWPRPRWCWSSRGWPAPPPTRSATRCATCRTGCWRSACAATELRRYGTAEDHVARARPGRGRAARPRSTGSSARVAA